MIKKFLLAGFLLVGGSFFIFGLFSFARAEEIGCGLKINEISSASTYNDWVELYNTLESDKDVRGWSVWDSGTTTYHRKIVTSLTGIVKAHDWVVVNMGNLLDKSGDNKPGDSVVLRGADDQECDRFDYGYNSDFSYEAPDESWFWARIPDGGGWSKMATATKGVANKLVEIFFTSTTPTTTLEVGETTPSSPSETSSPFSPISPPPSSLFFPSLKINEFVSNPATGSEWVELYNPTSEAVDITGGYICDSRVSTSTCKSLTGAVEAGGWLFIDLLSNSYLNNDGDSVILKKFDGAIVDRIDYGDEINPEKGESLARKIDGADTDNISDWAITTQMTPGAGNVVFQRDGEEEMKAASSTKTPSAAQAKSKEKQVGLKWKIKYDPRARQNIETMFSASTTLDPRGGRISYAWDFGDKIILGQDVSYIFATSGMREIMIRATSTAGTVDQKKIKIIVYPEKEIWGGGVIFSEILPNNFGEDRGEYARVKNITSSTINISNWKLAYNNDTYEIPTSTSILAGDYLTFYKIITGFALNNSGGQILLLNDNNELIDQVEYGKSREGDVYVFDGENCPDCQSGSRSLREKWKGESASSNIVKTPAATSAKSAQKIVYKGYSSTNISQARDFEKGRLVKVRGVVSVLPGNFGVQYFYISDGESGMQIYQYKKDFPKLAVGDLIEVKGTVSVANDTKRINIKNAKDVDILSIGTSIRPVSSSIENLAEENIGGLVKISGEITEIKSNLMYVDDGTTEAEIYFKNNAKIDKKKFKEGELVEVAGVLEKGKNGLQIWPRSNDDIIYAGLSQDLIDKQVAAEKATSGDAAEKYLTATAGGITTLLLAFLARARGLLVIGGLRKIVSSLGSKIIKRG